MGPSTFTCTATCALWLVEAAFPNFRARDTRRVSPLPRDGRACAFFRLPLARPRGSSSTLRCCSLSSASLRRPRSFREAMRERALQERRVLKEARHPFIVRLHAAFHTPADELALVMEYCPSGDLNDLLVRCGRPGLAEITVRKVLAEVLLALQYLHEDLDVVYRDLKPENIVFDAAMRAKLTDFGLARIGAARTGGASSFCGSKFYVAPEAPGAAHSSLARQTPTHLACQTTRAWRVVARVMLGQIVFSFKRHACADSSGLHADKVCMLHFSFGRVGALLSAGCR